MTDLKAGTVWETDISSWWETPSLQRNTYNNEFFERSLKKVSLYFSKSKEMPQQTKALIASQISMFRVRHWTTDFVIQSYVENFPSEKIHDIVHAASGEIKRGLAIHLGKYQALKAKFKTGILP